MVTARPRVEIGKNKTGSDKSGKVGSGQWSLGRCCAGIPQAYGVAPTKDTSRSSVLVKRSYYEVILALDTSQSNFIATVL